MVKDLTKPPEVSRKTHSDFIQVWIKDKERRQAGSIFLARQHFGGDTVTVRLKEMMEGGALKVNVKEIKYG